ncbi:YjeF domain protein [Talaromyces proteolyticus]|uniref:ATP-dependent (S)-NAD(P)H-hydrate dehydratase n=1 Tax=Talaromyces proteolyticus TaxID=1131652 RepID=A0AAD4Q376_9EURO|nr:YjeF domain protein [Talaromyces proteolyticus]KAH8701123.1 YjeF domain protein [Talaromyces proteolyticus]
MEPIHIATPSSTLLARVKKMVPPMLEKFHKGQLGRVAVIGGSADYTGAPYFSAMASARLGCDMSHVICEKSAAPVIKAYSPNLMVHPILASSVTAPSDSSPATLASPILEMLPRLHVLVIGPGLGRDGVTQTVVEEVMKEARNRSVPFVLDADGLLLVSQKPELVKGYKGCILTPNVVEFARLAKALGVQGVDSSGIQKEKGGSEDEQTSRASEACERLARALGGVTIIQKGQKDVISNGITSIVSDIRGGLKRSGGQGDTLTGTLGTFLAWRAAYHDELWETGEKEKGGGKVAASKEEIRAELEDSTRRMSPTTTLLLAAYAGSALTRDCSRRAFEAKGRSLQASDLTDEVHDAFLELIGEPEQSKL